LVSDPAQLTVSLSDASTVIGPATPPEVVQATPLTAFWKLRVMAALQA
jgi:hypothetical protein